MTDATKPDARTRKRKDEHLAVFAEGKASARAQTTLFECVHLDHNPLPEMSLDEIDLSATLAGKKLKAPFMITGMTGGTDKARDINRALAKVAQDLGLAMGLGSQRAMIEDPSLAATYEVRDIAPDIFLAGNIGGVQAARYGVDRILEAMKKTGADACCVHLNPAQEMAQPEGDRDFRGVLESIKRLVHELGMPVIVKETGAGIGLTAAHKLVKAGVEMIDVSGVGGSSWVGAEILRNPAEAERMEPFWDWGTPTAAAVLYAYKQGATVIASGGIRNGLDAAKAFSMGASLAGIAAPLVQAFFEGREERMASLMRTVIDGLKTAMILTGCRTVPEIRSVAKVITEPLSLWIGRKTK